jgi:hypothetical protein
MNTMAEVRKLTPSASTRFEFPIGYYELHPDISSGGSGSSDRNLSGISGKIC